VLLNVDISILKLQHRVSTVAFYTLDVGDSGCALC
jgi:hypothetical protein